MARPILDVEASYGSLNFFVRQSENVEFVGGGSSALCRKTRCDLTGHFKMPVTLYVTGRLYTEGISQYMYLPLFSISELFL